MTDSTVLDVVTGPVDATVIDFSEDSVEATVVDRDQTAVVVELQAVAFGGAADVLEWDQSSPSAEWVIAHPFRPIPSVTVVDSAGTQVIGDIDHEPGQVTVTFRGGFSGKAYLLGVRA